MKRLLLIGMSCLAVAQTVWAGKHVVTTADSHGADAFVTSAQNSPQGHLPHLRAEYDLATGASAKIYLRFDLESIRNQEIKSARLMLQPLGYRDWPQDLNIFGLRESRLDDQPLPSQQWMETRAADEQDEALAPLVWSNAPGNDPLIGGGYRQRLRENSAGVHETAEYLGRITIDSETGAKLVFESDALAAFLASDIDGLVTLIITRASRNSSPSLFASKESTIFSPPTLALEVTPVENLALIQRWLNWRLPGDKQPPTLGEAWRAIHVQARRSSWPQVAEAVQNLSDACRSASPPVAALARLLEAEAAYLGKRLGEADLTQVYVRELQDCPEDGAALLAAMNLLMPERWRPAADTVMTLEILQAEALPATASRFLLELVDARMAPLNGDAAKQSQYYLSQLASPRSLLGGSALAPPPPGQSLLTLRLEVQRHEAPLDAHWLAVDRAMQRGDWVGALAVAEKITEAMKRVGSASGEPPIAPRAALASMLEADLMLAAGRATPQQWLEHFEQALGQDTSGDALAAWYVISAPMRRRDTAVGQRLVQLRWRAVTGDALRLLERLTPHVSIRAQLLETPVKYEGIVRSLQTHCFVAQLTAGNAAECADSFRELSAALISTSDISERGRTLAALSELLAIEGKFVASELDEDHWAQAVGEVLNAHAHLAPELLAVLYLLQAHGVAYSPAKHARWAGLALPPIPSSAKELAQQLLALATEPSSGKPLESGEVPPVFAVNRAVASLDAAGHSGIADRALEVIMLQWSDAAVGAEAARIRVARLDLAERDDAVVRLFERAPLSATAASLRPKYLRVQQERGRLFYALQLIDGDGTLAAATSAREMARALHSLIHDATRQDSTSLSSAHLMLALLEQLIDTGDYVTAIELGALELGRESRWASEAFAELSTAARSADSADVAELPLATTAALALALLRWEQGDIEGASRLCADPLVLGEPTTGGLATLLQRACAVATGDREALEHLSTVTVSPHIEQELAMAATSYLDYANLVAVHNRAVDEARSAPSPLERQRALHHAARAAASLGWGYTAVDSLLTASEIQTPGGAGQAALADALMLLQHQNDNPQQIEDVRRRLIEQYGANPMEHPMTDEPLQPVPTEKPGGQSDGH